MSVSLQERKERAESRVQALLLGLDGTVREVYNSILESGTDHADLTEEQKVSRLEGFHDYIITREETGVDHPSLAEYIVAKKKYGNEMLSFGTGAHRNAIEAEDVVEEDIENSPLAASSEDEEYVELPAEEDSFTDYDSLLEEDAVTVESDVAVEEDEEVQAEEPEEVVTVEEEEAPAEETVTEEVPEDSQDVEDSVEAPESVEETPEVPEEEVAESASFFDEDDEVIIESSPENVSEEEPVVHAAGRINASTILQKELSTKIGGYNVDEVDDCLDQLADFFREPHTAEQYLAKVKEVEEVTFSKKTFKKGFVQDEVDGFLDVIVLELRNLAEEAN